MSKPLKDSAFILKAFNMISDSSTDAIVCWNEKGDGFYVKNEHDFAQKVLPIHFRHRNYSSFVRQLNSYGFQKKSTHQDRCPQFWHKSFRKGKPELLPQIKRKVSETNAQLKDTIADLQSQLGDLKQQYDEMWTLQYKILFVLSRYLRGTGKPRTAQTTFQIKPTSQGARRLSVGEAVAHPQKPSKRSRPLLLEPAPKPAATTPTTAVATATEPTALDEDLQHLLGQLSEQCRTGVASAQSEGRISQELIEMDCVPAPTSSTSSPKMGSFPLLLQSSSDWTSDPSDSSLPLLDLDAPDQWAMTESTPAQLTEPGPLALGPVVPECSSSVVTFLPDVDASDSARPTIVQLIEDLESLSDSLPLLPAPGTGPGGFTGGAFSIGKSTSKFGSSSLPLASLDYPLSPGHLPFVFNPQSLIPPT